MEFLKHIDWRNDDGVFLPMLNDVRRNQFYDRVLASSVAGQECVDIGFGTGLLSMISLKNGAKHITAYEIDPYRYQLGQYVIDSLGLNDQIELHNQRFMNDMYQPGKVYLTETVSSNIWGEKLFRFIPRRSGVDFFPRQYFLELWVQKVPAMYAERLFTPADQHSSFAPGVDINPEFVEVINQLLKSTRTDVSLKEGLEVPGYNEYLPNTVWGPWSFLKSAHFDATCVASYTVDVNCGKIFLDDCHGQTEQDINFNTNTVDLKIELHDSPSLIVPRAGIAHNTERLILDTAESWGPTHGPAIAWNPCKMNVSHNVYNGLITYSLE